MSHKSWKTGCRARKVVALVIVERRRAVGVAYRVHAQDFGLWRSRDFSQSRSKYAVRRVGTTLEGTRFCNYWFVLTVSCNTASWLSDQCLGCYAQPRRQMNNISVKYINLSLVLFDARQILQNNRMFKWIFQSWIDSCFGPCSAARGASFVR